MAAAHGAGAVPSPLVRVGIIGTAGRQGSHARLNAALFETMVIQARNVLTHDWQLDPQRVQLVSGGAAWADHVAVRLFLAGEVPQLVLHLPAPWDRATQRFRCLPKGAGASANYYHSLFSQGVGVDTFAELGDAIDHGATVLDHYHGFFRRNDAVAQQCDYLLALGLEGMGAPLPGSGTHYTWSKCPLPAESKCYLNVTVL